MARWPDLLCLAVAMLELGCSGAQRHSHEVSQPAQSLPIGPVFCSLPDEPSSSPVLVPCSTLSALEDAPSSGCVDVRYRTAGRAEVRFASIDALKQWWNRWSDGTALSVLDMPRGECVSVIALRRVLTQIENTSIPWFDPLKDHPTDQEVIRGLCENPVARAAMASFSQKGLALRSRVRDIARTGDANMRTVAALFLIEDRWIEAGGVELRGAEDDLVEFRPMLVRRWSALLTCQCAVVHDRALANSDLVRFSLPEPIGCVRDAREHVALTTRLCAVVNEASWPASLRNAALERFQAIERDTIALRNQSATSSPTAAFDALYSAIRRNMVREQTTVTIPDALAAGVVDCDVYAALAIMLDTSSGLSTEIVEFALAREGVKDTIEHIVVRIAVPGEVECQIWDPVGTHDGSLYSERDHFARVFGSKVASGYSVSSRTIALPDLLREQATRRELTR